MQPLWDAVLALVALVPPARVHNLARLLRGLPGPAAAPAARHAVETFAARSAYAAVVSAWHSAPTTGDELAGLLVGACEAQGSHERTQSVEFVWTGPTTRFAPTRRTEQVLLDLIDGASQELFLISFVAYEVPSVTSALLAAVARGIRVRLLLEASSEHGGSLGFDSLRLMREGVPGAELLTWANKTRDFVHGKVHAKIALADSQRAFVTSANLTGHALEKNMEAGVLMNGGDVPKALSLHLQALIDVRVIGPA